MKMCRLLSIDAWKRRSSARWDFLRVADGEEKRGKLRRGQCSVGLAVSMYFPELVY